jgi:membrane protease YdiL (CAAX protease family)
METSQMDAHAAQGTSQLRSGIGGLIQREPVASYFVMAFLFSWLAVTPLLMNRGNPELPQLAPEPFMLAGALAGPALSGIVVMWATAGFAGVRALLRRCVQWRAGLQWWLAVLLGPLVVLNIVATIVIGPSILEELFANLPLALATYLPSLIFGVILGPLWEEPGWRGVALPQLQQKYGPLIGTVLLGVLWWLWHFPGYLGGWLGQLTPSSFAAALLALTGFSLIMTYIYNNTRGSLLLMILFHSASNAAIALGGRVLPAEMSDTVRSIVYNGWIPAIGYGLSGLVVVIWTRGALGYGSRSGAQHE